MKAIIGQALGILGMIVLVLSYQQKKRERLLYFQIGYNALNTVSYFLLGAMPMVWISLINGVRSYVFSKSDTSWGSHPAWLYVFLAVPVISGVLTWAGPVSLLVMAATLVLTVALYTKNGSLMRKLFLIPPVLYFTYNLLIRHYGGIGSDVFCVISALIAIYRFDMKKTKV